MGLNDRVGTSSASVARLSSRAAKKRSVPLTCMMLARAAMGTRFELLLCGDDPLFLRAVGEEALDEIERLEAQLSRFRPDSELSGINARAEREPVAVEPRLFALLERIARLWEATGGAFDPTIGPLMACWGLAGGDRRPATNEQRPPDPAALAAARGRVGFQNVALDPETRSVRFLRPGMSLDLGAIGKGYAIETAAALLVEAGLTTALLHGGTSTVYGLGAPPDADAWTVAVRDPAAAAGDSGRHVARIRLRDRALSVSAPHGKSFVVGGVRYGHVLDPRRGEPVQGPLLAALVTDSPTDGDALSTALLVLGAEGAAAVRAYDPVCRGLLLTTDGLIGIGQPDTEIETSGIRQGAFPDAQRSPGT
jgi:thiamine biosynthesis lipoprotein